MLQKILVKNYQESDEIRESTPFYLGRGFGKPEKHRVWLYRITDSTDNTYSLGFGVRKQKTHKELHRGMTLFTEIEHGRIRQTFTEKEFRDKIEKEIAYLRECIVSNQKEISRLESQ